MSLAVTSCRRENGRSVAFSTAERLSPRYFPVSSRCKLCLRALRSLRPEPDSETRKQRGDEARLAEYVSP